MSGSPNQRGRTLRTMRSNVNANCVAWGANVSGVGKTEFVGMRLILGFWLLLVGVAYAQPKQQNIELRQGGQVVLRIDRPFSSVAVADPEVADVLPRSDRVLVIVGKKVGASDAVIFSDGEQLHHVTIVVAPSAVTGKIITHNQKNLTEYTAYQCNPVCARIKDEFEFRAPDVMILTPSGSIITKAPPR